MEEALPRRHIKGFLQKASSSSKNYSFLQTYAALGDTHAGLMETLVNVPGLISPQGLAVSAGGFQRAKLAGL